LSNPHYPLTKAYEEAQAIVEQQRRDEADRKERLQQFPNTALTFHLRRLPACRR